MLWRQPTKSSSLTLASPLFVPPDGKNPVKVPGGQSILRGTKRIQNCPKRFGQRYSPEADPNLYSILSCVVFDAALHRA